MGEFKYTESISLKIDQIKQCMDYNTIDKLPKRPYQSTIRRFEGYRDFALELYEWADSYLRERCKDYTPANLPLSLQSSKSDTNTCDKELDTELTTSNAPEPKIPTISESKILVGALRSGMSDLERNVDIFSSQFIRSSALVICQWFRLRYQPYQEGSLFFYRAATIPEYIDRMILAAAMYFESYKFQEYVQIVYSMIYDPELIYNSHAIPDSLFSATGSSADYSTTCKIPLSAIALERKIKPYIYITAPLSTNLHTIELGFVAQKRLPGLNSIEADDLNEHMKPFLDFNDFTLVNNNTAF